MADRRRPTTDHRQLTLEGYFEPPAPTELPGTMNFEHELRADLKKAITDSALGRDEIARRMTVLLGGDEEDFQVSKAMLDSWTGQSRKEWRFPLSYFPAFIQVTGQYWLMDRVAQKCGCRALVGEEAIFAEYGRLESIENDIEAQRVQIRERKQALRQKLPKRPRRA